METQEHLIVDEEGKIPVEFVSMTNEEIRAYTIKMQSTDKGSKLLESVRKAFIPQGKRLYTEKIEAITKNDK